MYYAPHADKITILLRNKQAVDISLEVVGKLSIRIGCKWYVVSAVLQASKVIISNTALKGGYLLSQIPLQHDCCEELAVAFNLSGLSLEITHKNIVPQLDDLRYASRKVSDWEKEIKGQERINHQFVKHHTYCIVVCVVVSVVLNYAVHKLFMCLRRCCNITPCTKIEGSLSSKMLPPPDSSGQILSPLRESHKIILILMIHIYNYIQIGKVIKFKMYNTLIFLCK
jgi:hypothetical protein